MSPALEDGQQVLVLRHVPIWFLRKNKFVVFDLSRAENIPHPKPTIVIKRLIGLPKDTVRIHASHVDQGMPIFDMAALGEDGYYEIRIPPDHCYIQADGKGSDSRHWGPIPLYALVGIVIKKMLLPGANIHEK